MEKILHVIKTKSFQSDGRLLKWITSLASGDISSEVIILEDKNQKENWELDKSSIQSVRLQSRKLFGKGKGYSLKIPEYSFKCLKQIIASDSPVIVFHDVQHYLTLYLLCVFQSIHKKRIIWDLHELPHNIICRLPIIRSLLRYILESVDLLIYTNNQRRDYLLNVIGHRERDYAILNNYPNKEYTAEPKAPLPNDLKEWLNGSPYMLWMGSASAGRNFDSVLEAYTGFQDQFKLVVMGSIAPEYEERIQTELGEGSVFSRFVAQSEIPKYVDNAMFSIVLYKNTTANNWLCEPNRLYQLISRGIPVICGNNPPMKRLVESLKVGVALEDDGSGSKGMTVAINECLANLGNYNKKYDQLDRQNLFSWENQFDQVMAKLQELVKWN